MDWPTLLIGALVAFACWPRFTHLRPMYVRPPAASTNALIGTAHSARSSPLSRGIEIAFTPYFLAKSSWISATDLPAARSDRSSARFSSGLGVLDFVKRTSILKCGPDQLAALAPAAIALGEAEGVDAHARSVAIRLNRR